MEMLVAHVTVELAVAHFHYADRAVLIVCIR